MMVTQKSITVAVLGKPPPRPHRKQTQASLLIDIGDFGMNAIDPCCCGVPRQTLCMNHTMSHSVHG